MVPLTDMDSCLAYGKERLLYRYTAGGCPARSEHGGSTAHGGQTDRLMKHGPVFVRVP